MEAERLYSHSTASVGAFYLRNDRCGLFARSFRACSFRRGSDRIFAIRLSCGSFRANPTVKAIAIERTLDPTCPLDRSLAGRALLSAKVIDRVQQLERTFNSSITLEPQQQTNGNTAVPEIAKSLHSASPSTSGRSKELAVTPLIRSTKRSSKTGLRSSSNHSFSVNSVRASRLGARSVARNTDAAELKQRRNNTKRPSSGHSDPDSRLLKGIRSRLEKGRLESRQKGSRLRAYPDAVSQFLIDTGNTGLLSREEEIRLGTIVQQGNVLQARYEHVCQQFGMAPTEQQLLEGLGVSLQALQQVLSNAVEAKDLMVQYNIRLVIAIAKKYTGRGIDFGDLLPEGICGLTKAVEKFDPSKGFKFSTYAHWWIRQAVTRCITQHSRTVRLPVHVYAILNKINRATQELSSQNDRTEPPTCHEIGAAVGLTGAKVLQYLKAAQPLRSLEATVYATSTDDDNIPLVDTIAADSSPGAEEYSEAVDSIIREDMNALLSTLAARERNVLRMRYGLHNAEGKSMTFNDIAAAYGLTKERIRQIEDKALSKLKRPWRRKLLRPQLYNREVDD